MKLVNFYHFVGIVVLILMAVFFSVGFNESAMVWGICLLVVFVLGVILSLDNLKNQINYHEKRISEISSNVESINASVEIIGKLVNQDMVYSAQTLDEIRQELGKLSVEIKNISPQKS